jgi:hypothetical protein
LIVNLVLYVTAAVFVKDHQVVLLVVEYHQYLEKDIVEWEVAVRAKKVKDGVRIIVNVLLVLYVAIVYV